MSIERISRESIEQASLWMARLWADDVTEQDKKAFNTWRSAHPDNEFAWQQLETLQKKFAAVPNPELSGKVLHRDRRGVTRRQALIWAGISFGTLGLMMAGRSDTPSGAEYATATGEIRSLTLSDGTEMIMNTATRVYVDFNQSERMLHLVQGEIMITSAHHLTPFMVTTGQGNVVPIGTRFTVQQQDNKTKVSVYEGEVAVYPKQSFESTHLLAGENVAFSAEYTESKHANATSNALWLSQKILAQATPLPEFINDLARYRRGVVNVDPSLSHLKLTGVFSTKDTDKTLHNISQVLPIEVHYRTPLWVSIKAKDDN
ncbi:FecR domain-containing protein [Vibrio nigripulchritudo]|uniref:FecR domain-containing protein n=1 Tax=Vibrio nigripulchritudo TaxID=28173 RepID=UPI001FCC4F61|nr:FecR domain-containing protein [Vibrio nigripulchritudo]